MVRLTATIAAGLTQLGLSEEIAPQLARYVAQLNHWNRVFNLTAVRDPEAMVVRHLFDSLAIGPWLLGPRVLDIGSGAGLPGIPLAIAHPALHFELLDSSGKRTRFMTQMVAELALKNVSVTQMRVEDYTTARTFSTITARAFAAPCRLLALAERLCAPGGRVLAMQGATTGAETAPERWHLVANHRLVVPGLKARRRLLQFEPRAVA